MSSAPRFVCTHPGCGAGFAKKGKLTRHERTHSDVKQFPCTFPDCGRAYTRSEHLKRHMMSHGERTHRCTMRGCSKSFFTKEKLNRHLKCHEKAPICTVCNKTFKKRSMLLAHEHAAHNPQGPLPFPCKEDGCHASFATWHERARHCRLKHAAARYTCDMAGCVEQKLEFRRFSDLQTHLRSVHKTVTPYACKVCKPARRFQFKEDLRKHQKDEHEFQCTFPGCEKSYSQKKHLNAHIASAHNQRRFVCEIETAEAGTTIPCSASYTTKQALQRHQKKNLNAHIASAHNQRRFVCEIETTEAGTTIPCNASYTTKQALQRHQVRVHSLASSNISSSSSKNSNCSKSSLASHAARLSTSHSSQPSQASSSSSSRDHEMRSPRRVAQQLLKSFPHSQSTSSPSPSDSEAEFARPLPSPSDSEAEFARPLLTTSSRAAGGSDRSRERLLRFICGQSDTELSESESAHARAGSPQRSPHPSPALAPRSPVIHVN